MNRIRKHSMLVPCLLTFAIAGCGVSYDALSPGNSVPELVVAGWINDVAPDDMTGKVVVIEAFATW